MKKFFAIAMASAMIASMSAVSFAATGLIATSHDDSPTIKVEDNKTYYPVVDAIGPFTYDSDDKALDSGVVEYGETAYFMLLQGNDGDHKEADDGNDLGSTYKYEVVTESDVQKSLKVKTDWEEGKNLVKGINIVKKKVNNLEDEVLDKNDNKYPSMTTLLDESSGKASAAISNYNDGKYYYFIAISTNSSTSTSDSDIIGTITLNQSKDPKVDDLDMDIAINVGWENSYNNNAAKSDCFVDGDVGPLDSETYYAMKFDCDDEVDIEFEDESIFTVDVSGQSKLLVYYDTDYNSKVAAKYPLADLNFWNGNGAKFNRIGQMFLDCDKSYAEFLYQVNADGTLSEVSGAKYDEYDEGFYFNTRVLGTYVISDMELELTPAATTTTQTQTTTTTVTPATTTAPSNPRTGAIA